MDRREVTDPVQRRGDEARQPEGTRYWRSEIADDSHVSQNLILYTEPKKNELEMTAVWQADQQVCAILRVATIVGRCAKLSEVRAGSSRIIGSGNRSSGKARNRSTVAPFRTADIIARRALSSPIHCHTIPSLPPPKSTGRLAPPLGVGGELCPLRSLNKGSQREQMG
jgi:hypothetical protein